MVKQLEDYLLHSCNTVYLQRQAKNRGIICVYVNYELSKSEMRLLAVDRRAPGSNRFGNNSDVDAVIVLLPLLLLVWLLFAVLLLSFVPDVALLLHWCELDDELLRL